VPPTGLTNWYQRGQQITGSSSIQPSELLSTSTGSKGQLVLAVRNKSVGPCVLELEAENQTAQDYRQYTYRRSGAFTIINGVEDGVNRKVLRYDLTGPTPDQVEVYVNGVKRTAGTGANQYQLYDGSVGSPVPPNSVLFNTQITGTNTQVDIIVRKASATSTVLFTLEHVIDDDSRVGLGSWEGIDYVRKLPSTDQWHLFYLDFDEIVQPINDVKLRVKSVTVAGAGTPLSDVAILFARSPYTSLDRERSIWAPLSSLVNGYLVVKLNDAVKTLMVTATALAEVFPALVVQRHNEPTFIRTGLSGSDEAVSLDHELVIGPDS
jgi:hypothetical protein